MKFHRAYAATLLMLSVAVGCARKTDSTPEANPAAPSATVAPAAATPTEAPAGGAPSAARAHMVLCAHQLGKPPKEMPKTHFERVGKKDELPESLPVGEGHWTWLNFWSTSCSTCDEEILRLEGWEAKAASEPVSLKVAFIATDADEQHLEKYLEGQPSDGLHATYWLPEEARRAWLKEAGVASEPEVPAHFLVDPSGQIRCAEEGTLESGDLAEVLKILRGERGGHSGVRGSDQHGHKDVGRK